MLIARVEVLRGYVGQFELMKQCNLTAQEFEAELLSIEQEGTVDGLVMGHIQRMMWYHDSLVSALRTID